MVPVSDSSLAMIDVQRVCRIRSVLTCPRRIRSVILDEAQCIKNSTTKAAQATFAIQSETRFCLTGTPMMNNVGELHSLIRFLRIRPYDQSRDFHRVSFIPSFTSPSCFSFLPAFSPFLLAPSLIRMIDLYPAAQKPKG